MYPKVSYTRNFKNLAWIVFGGYGIGILTRRSWDSIKGIPNLVDVSLIDLDSILYGSSLVVLLLLLQLTIYTLVECRPWIKATECWETCTKRFPNKKSFKRIPWIFFRGLQTAFLHTLFYFWLAAMICIALAGKTDYDWLKIFLVWSTLVFIDGIIFKNAIPPMWLGKKIAKFLDLPAKDGPVVVFSILLTFLFAMVIFPNIRQSFGGGKPDRAIVFLKQNNSATLPSIENIEGKIVYIAFRKGTKIGFKSTNSKDNSFLVIDQEKIDRLYVGNKINEIDIEKLK